MKNGTLVDLHLYGLDHLVITLTSDLSGNANKKVVHFVKVMDIDSTSYTEEGKGEYLISINTRQKGKSTDHGFQLETDEAGIQKLLRVMKVIA